MPSQNELGNWPYANPQDYIAQNAQAFERGAKEAQAKRDKTENARDLREFFKSLATIFSLDKKHVSRGEPSLFQGAGAPGVTGSPAAPAAEVTPPMAGAAPYQPPPVPSLDALFSMPGPGAAVQPPMAPPREAEGVTAAAPGPAGAVTPQPPAGADRMEGILTALSQANNPMMATEATNKLFGNVNVEPRLHNVPANSTVLDAQGNVVYQAPRKKQTLRLGANQVGFEENEDGSWSQVAQGPAGATRYTQIQDNQGYYYFYDPINKAAIPTGVQGVVKGGASSRWIRLAGPGGQVTLVDALDPTNKVETGLFAAGKSPYDYEQVEKKALSAEKIARLRIAASERIAAFERETKERIDSPAKLFTHLLKNDRAGLSTAEDRELLDYLAPIIEKEGTLTQIIKRDSGQSGPAKPWQPPQPPTPPPPKEEGFLDRLFGSPEGATAGEPGNKGTPARPSGGNAEPPVPTSMRKEPKVTGAPATTAPVPGAKEAKPPGAKTGEQDFGPQIKLQDGTVAKKEADGKYYFMRGGQKYLLRPKSNKPAKGK